ncbi:MAG: hypothetical protein RLZZ156_338 [Deinococcota bacterium]|jgi:multisubunit Na+/H+ antiporter MnhC subunit
MKYLWYAFIGVYIVTGFTLVVLNSAGVIFGLGLLGFAALLHMVWLGVGMLIKIEKTLNRNDTENLLENIAYYSQRTADHLEQIANEAPKPPPAKQGQGAAKDVSND